MKIQIEKKTALIIKRFLRSLPISIIYFIVVFILSAIFIPIIKNQGIDESINLISLVAGISSLIYLLIRLTDVYLFSKSSYIEFSENSINVYSSGFKKHDFSFKISEVQAINSSQKFFDRILGITTISIRQIAGVLTISGFTYKDARKLISEFNQAKK